jgi:hypothetical protein
MDGPAPATGAPGAAAPAERAARQGSIGVDAPLGAVRVHIQCQQKSLVLTALLCYPVDTMSGAACRLSPLPHHEHAGSCMPEMGVPKFSLHAGTHANEARPALTALQDCKASRPARAADAALHTTAAQGICVGAPNTTRCCAGSAAGRNGGAGRAARRSGQPACRRRSGAQRSRPGASGGTGRAG